MDDVAHLLEWSARSYSAPYKLVLLPTYRCNLDCLFCGDAAERREGRVEEELPDREWLSVLDAVEGIGEIWVPGLGEPLMRPGLLISIFKKIRQDNPDAILKITTNGTLFTEDLVRKFVQLRVNRISISLDSPVEEVHDRLRGRKGAFRNVIRALGMFSSQAGYRPAINFNAVLTNMNYKDLPALSALAQRYGVQEISLNPLRIEPGNERYASGLRLDKAMEKEAKKIISGLSDAPSPVRFNGFLNMEMGPAKHEAEGFTGKDEGFMGCACFEPYLTMSINYRGDVAYCTSCGHWDKAENVMEKSLIDIWKGPSFAYARKKMLAGEPMDSCYGCGIMRVRQRLREELTKRLKHGR
jgi:MoaA/NifB/PqqE/SkfB family radical SAM enzyme